MTPEQAIARLEAARVEIPKAMRDAINAVGERALFSVRGQTPVDTGLLAASWGWDGNSLENSADYASEVHDGHLERLALAEIEKLDPLFAEIVESRVSAAGGF